MNFGKLKEVGADSRPNREWLIPKYVADPPRDCLSLSGGGMRSASYAIGAMKALSEFNKLDTMDVISGVSGGTYAMMWYYSGMYRNNASSQKDNLGSAELFSEQNIDRFIRGHSRLHYLKRATFERPLALAAGLISNAWNAKDLLPNSFMSQRLKDPLLFDSGDMLGSLYTGRLSEFYSEYAGNSKMPTLSQLDGLVTQHQLPWPIFNMTAYDDAAAEWFQRKRLFEVTPYMVGSDSAGYAAIQRQQNTVGEYVFDQPLSNYVRASGAALDVPIERTQYSALRALIGYGLGLRVYTPIESDDVSPNILYLADGGFSENLGIYALARRGCSVITAIDAEYDPWFEFEGYYVSKRHIYDGLSNNFSIPTIDRRLCDSIMNPIAPDLLKQCKPQYSTWPYPLMQGHIKRRRVSGDSDVNHENSDIVVRYLKLSVDRDHLPLEVKPVPAGECNDGERPEPYFTKHLVEHIRMDPQFPQIPTTNQWLLEDAVGALIDLGYAHMKSMICQTIRHS